MMSAVEAMLGMCYALQIECDRNVATQIKLIGQCVVTRMMVMDSSNNCVASFSRGLILLPCVQTPGHFIHVEIRQWRFRKLTLRGPRGACLSLSESLSESFVSSGIPDFEVSDGWEV